MDQSESLTNQKSRRYFRNPPERLSSQIIITQSSERSFLCLFEYFQSFILAQNFLPKFFAKKKSKRISKKNGRDVTLPVGLHLRGQKREHYQVHYFYIANKGFHSGERKM